MKHAVLPRLIRIGEAPAYLGMSRALFDREVRPTLTVVRIGSQGLAVDRCELEAWADRLFDRQRALDGENAPAHYNGCSGRPDGKGGFLWGVRRRGVSSAATASGISRNTSKGMDDFARALAVVTMEKPSDT
jgi:predicted DNA-binding transcriptional regulator AlpA